MVVIREHGPTPLHQPIQASRNPDHQTLHAAAESEAVDCLDQQMDVVALHGELDDAAAEAVLRELQALTHHLEAARRAQLRGVVMRDADWPSHSTSTLP
jgi:hypothetical protein